MNIGIYRLVYNTSRGIWMAVGEHVRSHQSGQNSAAKVLKRSCKQNYKLSLGILILSIGMVGKVSVSFADVLLPASTLPTGLTITNGSFVGANGSTIGVGAALPLPAALTPLQLNINQITQKGILQGNNFSIGSAATVNFNHLGGSGSATLVRITGNNKSIIEGSLNSPNGKLFLINQNGILFANGARVDVNGLVASALDISDGDFLSNLGDLNAFANGQRASYVWGGTGAEFQEVLIQVEPDANIKAALGSSVMLFAPKVINQGSIHTTEGQVVLAAGEKVYLSVAPQLISESGDGYVYAKDSPYRALAGVLVEVDSYKMTDTPAVPAEITGEVVNDTMGRILAQRGNITMAGFLVNQNGRVTATSSVSQKGSIRLLARDTVEPGNVLVESGNPNDALTEPTFKLAPGQTAENYFALTTRRSGADVTQENIVIGARAGKLNIGENSITTVLGEDTATLVKAKEIFAAPQVGEPVAESGEQYVDKVLAAVNVKKNGTVTEDQIFSAPTIEAVGRQVTVGENAQLVVPGGYINLSAQKNGAGFNYLDTNTYDAESRLFVGKNALIDVAGLKDVEVDLSRNFVEQLLTLTDLKDNPINRDGFLYRKRVIYDIRNLPDSKVADLDGFVSQVNRSLGERLAQSGGVKLKSEGDLIQGIGSEVDVSGGTLKFNTGINTETRLVAADGKNYALGDAPVDTLFVGFTGGNNSFIRQEVGYTEGKKAGSLEFTALNMALDGQISGGATYGEYQRESAGLGGNLAINALITNDNTGGRSINIAKTVPLDTNFKADDALPESRIKTIELDATKLNNGGFEQITLNTPGGVKVNAELKMAEGTSFSINNILATNEINNSITARGGSIAITQALIADNVKLDVSGNWINDAVSAPTGRILTKGGNVAVTLKEAIGKNTLIDVAGGGWLQADKKLVKGVAGNIDIVALKDPSSLLNNVELRGYALGTGGNLSITAPHLTIGDNGFGDVNELVVGSSFFQNGGFSSYNLTGGNTVVVRDNANLNVLAKNYRLNPNFTLQATGENLHDFASVTLLPDYLRSSTSLSLSTSQSGNTASVSGVLAGSLVVETGAKLSVDANGLRTDSSGKKVAPTIALSAWNNQLSVDGTLKALGGDIQLTMNGDLTSLEDTGYNPSQVIWLGENASLNASGHTVFTPNNVNQRIGTVYDGGHVTVDAKKGYVVAKTGSEIDVSGTSVVLDIRNTNQITPTKIASNGGDITIAAREGLLLDATFNAISPGALAGSLEVKLSRNGSDSNDTGGYPGTQPNPLTFPNGYLRDQQWIMDVSQNGTAVPSSLNLGESLEPLAAGLAKVSAGKVMGGGFSEVALKAEDVIRFTQDVNLDTTRIIKLDARAIEAVADAEIKLIAPNVVLSNDVEQTPLRNRYTALTPVAGTANLQVDAELLDVKGQVALSGFSTSFLNSTGDVRLTGANTTTTVPQGQLLTAGDLTFKARQIYTTSLSDFDVTVNGLGGNVTFNKVNPNDGYDKVLSAGSKLTVTADTINQNGVLLAPFGTIELNASEELNLNKDSVTSVSAQGALIPFGSTGRAGLDYVYDYGSVTQFTLPPERAVKLNSPNVNQNTDSKIDISGGGDLFAYEWIKGLGGSADVLANDANQSAFGKDATNTWAIMPTNNQTFAGFDTQYWDGSSIKAGDAVYIAGTANVAAGYYTLLPARYALLPGAVLVSSVNGAQDRTAGLTQTLINGSNLVSGHLAAYTSNGYVQTSRTGGFVVRSGADAYKLAQYNTTTASTFFKDNTQAQQTADSGRLSIAATNSLVLKGILDALPKQDGRGAEVDIAAPRLLVVDSGQPTGQVPLDGETFLAVDEATLESFNVASLTLGGTRSDGKLDVISSDVRMGTNAELSGPEVILAATDNVRLDTGARLTGKGSGATAKDLVIGDVDGDGALVRVSGGKATQVTRLNTDGDRGELLLGNGAVIEGDGSVLLDASKNINLAGELAFAKGAALGFSSSRISLGAPSNNETVTDGLWLQKAQLDKFVDAGSLLLKSQSSIDLYGDTSFGNSNFDLTLQSAGIAGYQNAGNTAVINTRNFTINNSDNASFATTTTLGGGTLLELGTGNLVINAQTVSAGNNMVRLAGFNQVDLTATKEIVATGNLARDTKKLSPNKLLADNNLHLNGLLTTDNNADYAFEAETGALKLQGAVGAQPNNLSESKTQVTKLALSGQSVLIAGSSTQTGNTAAAIVVKGGKITVEATGTAATDNVTIESGASIDAKGTAFVINDQTTDLPAGKLVLASKNGDVDVQQGALIDLSASGNGDAGQFEVSAANGQAKIASNIKAADIGAKGKNAIASVDAKTIDNFSQTIANLATFSGAQTYRARDGSITVAAADKIVAKDVKIEASNDAIVVNGIIDASGDQGGSIEIYAKNNATIANGAQLLAKGLADKTSIAGGLGDGGNVLISSDIGIVSTAASVNGAGGAFIDVSGDQVGAIKGGGGKVTFRAARTGAGAGAGVNVDSKVAEAVKGAKQITIEAVKRYDYTDIGAAEQNAIKSDTDSFVAAISPTIAGFSQSSDIDNRLSVTLAPGVEVKSAGDLTVSRDWILGSLNPLATQTNLNLLNSTLRSQMLGGGVLSLIASDNLNIIGNLDFESYAVSGTGLSTGRGNLVAQNPNSWSYRLTAGADASAVNPETVKQGVGDIVVSDSKFIRTGTGYIHAAAGRNIQLGTETGVGAAIYTEGLPEAIAEQGLMNSPTGFRLLATNFQTNRELYASGGGNVSLDAGGNISGSATRAENQTVRNWLYHAALSADTKNPQVRWWNRYDRFTNGVATLGGGAVNIKTGGDLSNLQVATATTGRMGGDVNSNPDIANFVETGGGDINIAASGSVNKTLLHAGKGVINVKADGNVESKLSLMSAQVGLFTNGDVTISAVSNPTIGSSLVSLPANKVTFYSYDEDTLVGAVSQAGNISITGNIPTNLSLTGILPSNLSLTAASGDLTLSDNLIYPAATGNATLLAGNNINIINFVMSDVDPEKLSVITTANIKSAANPSLLNYVGASGHTEGLLHASDRQPNRIYAGNDIVFKPQAPLVSPKRTEIKAGNDVVDANLIIQNNLATDVSIIEAGNNIRYTTPELLANGTSLPIEAGVQIAGPGRLHVIAGNDVDLGTSSGIVSIGNSSTSFNNPFLPEQGADVLVNAGAAAVADYQGIIKAYIDTPSIYSSIYLPQLTQFMQKRTNNTSLSDSQALADFKMLDRTAQTAFINQVFYAELKAGGRDAIDSANDSFGDYSRSERAILNMFPTFAKTETTKSLLAQSGSIMNDFAKIAEEEIAHPGDLSLFYSQIRSERGGRVELLVPGGFVNAGLEVSGGVTKPNSDLGIVSLRGGELLGFVRGDFQVNQSRVFTLGGSDLMLYSALEDIDAGKGAKTVSSTPPPVIRIVNGQVVFDFSGAVTGSGIAALTSTGGDPGTVDLFAPYGEINAGEAGIRSAGNINLGARVIIGADNISAGGVTTGAPVASTAGVGLSAPASADPTSQTKQGSTVADSAKTANNKLAELPSLITVEVVSLGDESSPAKPSANTCSSDDKAKKGC